MAKSGHNVRAIAHANFSQGQKIKYPKTCEKRLYKHIRAVLSKSGSKKQLIFEKLQHFENGQKWPQFKGYNPQKIPSLGDKVKMLKHAKNVSTNTLELFYAKKLARKNS